MVRGFPTSLDQLKQRLDSLLGPDFQRMEQQRASATQALCPLCYEDCSGPTGYTLQACGHRMCKNCAQQGLAAYSGGPPILGLHVGCHPTCQAPIIWADLQALTSPEALQQLMSQARYSSIISRKDQYMRCWSPDCDQLRRISPDTATSWSCDVCQETYCPACCERFEEPMPAHPGVSCQDNQESRLGATYDPAAETTLYAKCPGCKATVYKETGCLHISCPCGVHFCFGCGAGFGTSSTGVYNHIGTCQGPRARC